jgi:hypothetical protein
MAAISAFLLSGANRLRSSMLRIMRVMAPVGYQSLRDRFLASQQDDGVRSFLPIAADGQGNIRLQSGGQRQVRAFKGGTALQLDAVISALLTGSNS